MSSTSEKEAGSVEVVPASNERDVSILSVPDDKKIFKGMTFYFVPNLRRTFIYRIRFQRGMDFGGVSVHEFCSEVTHIICNKDHGLEDVERELTQAIPERMTLVNSNWFHNCKDEGILYNADEQRYRVLRATSTPSKPPTCLTAPPIDALKEGRAVVVNPNSRYGGEVEPTEEFMKQAAEYIEERDAGRFTAKQLEMYLRDLARKENIRRGKWMLFGHGEYSTAWAQTVKATASGQLGCRAEIQMFEGKREGEWGVGVFTENFDDIDEVTRVCRNLKALGLTRQDDKLFYKCEYLTMLGMRRRNEWGIKTTLYDNVYLLRK